MKFETGKTYTTRSACDYNCIFKITVASRTPKTLTLDDGKRVKIRQDDDGREWCLAMGRYSMAPVFVA